MLEVVKVEKEGSALLVTIRGKTVGEASSAEGRRLAYDARVEHGFERAGINTQTGPYMVNLQTKKEDGQCSAVDKVTGMKEEDIAYENTYKLITSM